MPWQHGLAGEKFNRRHRIAGPENRGVDKNSAQLFFTGAEL